MLSIYNATRPTWWCVYTNCCFQLDHTLKIWLITQPCSQFCPSPMFPHHPCYHQNYKQRIYFLAPSRKECPLYPKMSPFCRWLLKMYATERLRATEVTACAWSLGGFADAVGVGHLALEPSDATGTYACIRSVVEAMPMSGVYVVE